MERSDRRVSDSRALELLREVKEKGKTAQQLREDEVRWVDMVFPLHAAVELPVDIGVWILF